MGTVTQTATQTGDSDTSVQVAGNHIDIRIG